MTTLRHYSLGEPCPLSPHAVVSSLPTMADVCGYEEREARVLNALKSGYPRFVLHAFVAEITAYFLEREHLIGRDGVLVPGERAAQDLIYYCGRGVVVLPLDASLSLVHFDVADRVLAQRVRKFVQHTGYGITSRQAEDLLVANGLRDTLHVEKIVSEGAQVVVESELSALIGCATRDLMICASGMSAFYAGFRSVQALQSSRGRTQWLQLGWLYLDSGCVLEKFLNEGESLDHCYDVSDTEALIARIEASGDALAGVVIECPTNPIVQVGDLERIAEVVRRVGGAVIVDPTIASIYNVDVLPYADVLVTSLTKYASCEGDVMIGAIAFNVNSPYYQELMVSGARHCQAPYARDLARLAYELKRAPAVVAVMDRNARVLAEYLSEHPAVAKVHYAGFSERFASVAKRSGAGGAMITIELNGDLASFYDVLEVMKGPSFGTEYTLVCPFMYLAHYDLVTSKQGRVFLRSIGIEPDLIRISVGVEPAEAIIETFGRALARLEQRVRSV
ncbi:PLP-dependent transferase [Coraliomargarita sp. SDUM461004]|uniref:PLP-dependent transferase n=1 Tax=Thalassobacterium sedimentorum TaxID=3041258 RepID=A0ABU1ANB2_9BACT|nr:PLP-dependent transferase [Coraliomargarita sp. SDUM461004]MDQ8196288.1 PLP-dependent transferase [Coraliomargarita sp. SDUM461004]